MIMMITMMMIVMNIMMMGDDNDDNDDVLNRMTAKITWLLLQMYSHMNLANKAHV